MQLNSFGTVVKLKRHNIRHLTFKFSFSMARNQKLVSLRGGGTPPGPRPITHMCMLIFTACDVLMVCNCSRFSVCSHFLCPLLSVDTRSGEEQQIFSQATSHIWKRLCCNTKCLSKIISQNLKRRNSGGARGCWTITLTHHPTSTARVGWNKAGLLNDLWYIRMS